MVNRSNSRARKLPLADAIYSAAFFTAVFLRVAFLAMVGFGFNAPLFAPRQTPKGSAAMIFGG
jgi:hypothetical protein